MQRRLAASTWYSGANVLDLPRVWHTFQRGLATNLCRLGVLNKRIQVILRVKFVAEDSVAMMKVLEVGMRQYALKHGKSAPEHVVN